MQKIIVLAGRYAEAKEFARQNNLSDFEWIYPDSPDKIRGLRGAWYIKIGTWYKRKNVEYIEQQFKAQDFREIKMEGWS